MVKFRILLPVLAAFVYLSGCQVASGTETATATKTLIPFETSTASATPSPVTEAVGEQPEDLLPSPTPFVHEVQEGETLLSIALRYGVTLDGMLAANPGLDPRFLSIGQALRIPGPEGQPADTLLPTSTPLPLSVTAAQCYQAVDELWWCLAEVENDTDNPVEGLTARVRFLDEAGELLESSLAYAPLNRLPADGRLPLLASVADESSTQVFARFDLLSAVSSQGQNSRYAEVQISDLEREPLDEGVRWRVTGELSVTEQALEGELRISVLAMALDASDRIVGYSKWEPSSMTETSVQFETQVYSLGPLIQSIEVLAEAVQVES